MLLSRIQWLKHLPVFIERLKFIHLFKFTFKGICRIPLNVFLNLNGIHTIYDPFHFKRIFAKIINFMIHNKMAHQNQSF